MAEKLPQKQRDLLNKRETAVVAYYRAKLALAEAHSAVVKEGISAGILTPKDMAGQYW